MLVDTHVHLSHRQFAPDLPDVIRRARAAGVRVMLIPAIDLPSIERANKICEGGEGIYAMAGIHPSYTKDTTESDFQRIVTMASDPAIVAIGESGLDYYHDRSFDEKQQELLRRHARLAMRVGKPLILHNRDASDDLLRILREEREASPAPERLRGIFHCFSGPATLGRSAIELGFMLGVGGNVTYKNSPTAAALTDLDLADLVLETDGPFLAPVPYRGKRNEPAYVALVAEAVAAIKGVTVAEVAEVTTANALRLFGLPDYLASSSSTTS